MALRYEFFFDIAMIGTLAYKLTDAEVSGSERTFTTGSYCHTTFAAALETSLETGHVTTGYTVTWNGATGYTIAYSSTPCTIAFSTVTTAAQGTRLRQTLGMSGDRSGGTTYSSQVRPYYLIVPAIQGRSQVSDEHEPEGLMFEAVSDDGVAYQISKDTSEILYDWIQVAETETAPSTFSDPGTPPFTRLASAAVPWVYQDAWAHMRLGDHPFYVVDGSVTSKHQIRADGASFRPQRFMGPDLPYWTIPFRTRLLDYI